MKEGLYEIAIKNTRDLARSTIQRFPTPDLSEMHDWRNSVYEKLKEAAGEGEFYASIIFVNKSTPSGPDIGSAYQNYPVGNELSPRGFFEWFYNMYMAAKGLNKQAYPQAKAILDSMVTESLEDFVEFWNENSDVEAILVDTPTTVRIDFDWREPTQKRAKN